jgi:hypothetical protein
MMLFNLRWVQASKEGIIQQGGGQKKKREISKAVF